MPFVISLTHLNPLSVMLLYVFLLLTLAPISLTVWLLFQIEESLSTAATTPARGSIHHLTQPDRSVGVGVGEIKRGRTER